MDILNLCKSGITIDEVIKNGPLHNKLKSSDIICNVDDYQLDNFGNLMFKGKKYNFNEYLFFKNPESKIKLKYISNNELKDIEIKLENKNRKN